MSELSNNAKETAPAVIDRLAALGITPRQLSTAEMCDMMESMRTNLLHKFAFCASSTILRFKDTAWYHLHVTTLPAILRHANNIRAQPNSTFHQNRVNLTHIIYCALTRRVWEKKGGARRVSHTRK